MIQKSFVFLDRLNSKKEKQIWEQGIVSWDMFLNTESVEGISNQRKAFYDSQLKKAKQALSSGDSSYFIGKLKSSENWRLYDYFKEEVCFLDIETTGLHSGAYITVIGVYDGYDTRQMIQGMNLDVSALKKLLSQYKLIVTFNGASFDLPFIERKYPGILPDVPNLDLKHACRKLGLTGGLKHIEKELGIIRPNKVVANMNGGDAVRLWRMYRASGNEHYLKTLIEYNEEDCINLKWIADRVVKRLREEQQCNPSNFI
jgi:uncharacterized protein YprB with RNaseH-like and TPR domain